MIVADQLTKKYGSRTAVDAVSFRVPRGEVVGFLGPNGAGKSTTLKVVSGFMPPTSGRVEVAGHDVVDEPLEARRHIGYMPEAVPLYPEMRVEEYLTFRAEIKGVARAKRKAAVARAMEQADVADVARRIIGELSKGYRQRVGLADALVAAPPLLILDEPTAGLDPNQILHVRELIKSLGREHTIFLSTHILPEVEAVCSRVVIIARGRVAAEGTPDEIRARLQGQGRVATLVVRADEAKAREAIAKVAAVRVTAEPVRERLATGDAVLRFALELDDAAAAAGSAAPASADPAEELVAACVAAGLGVRGLEVKGKSLEAIFHELTTEEKPAEPPDGSSGSGATAPATATATATATGDDARPARGDDRGAKGASGGASSEEA